MILLFTMKFFFFLFCSFCFICLFVCFQDKVSLCSPGCPGTHSVDQAGLKYHPSTLPLPLKCWDLKSASGSVLPGGTGPPQTGVTECWKLLQGCWEGLNLGAPEKAVSAEPPV